MEILVKDGVMYNQYQFENENQFEKTALRQHRMIFGDNAILFDKQKIRTETGIGTIPDAFVILPDKRKWIIIEVELSSHDVYQHIIPQMIKFRNAIQNDRSRRELAKAFDTSINEDLYKHAQWTAGTKDRNVFRLLSEIIEQEPELLIIIDNPKKELENSINSLPFKTKINVFKTYCREGFGLGDNIYHFEAFVRPADAIKEIETKAPVSSRKIVGLIDKSENRSKAASPSAAEWAKQISDLEQVQGLNNWAAICSYLKIEVGGNSARRALEAWVKRNRPDWLAVPNA